MSKKVEAIRKQSAVADMNAKKRDREIENDKNAPEEILDEVKSAFRKIKEITGEDYFFGKKKNQNSRVAFTQLMTHNIQLLMKINYLTNAEESFLFRISSLLDFKTNIIVEEGYKNASTRTSRDIPAVAGPQYLADLNGVHRTTMSRMMNTLKKKGILGTADTGTRTEDGRYCNSRTWFVNPNIIYCGEKSDIDQTVQMIFRDSLKYLKDQNGKKVKLPTRLFI